jgi:hypothetical protein
MKYSCNVEFRDNQIKGTAIVNVQVKNKSEIKEKVIESLNKIFAPNPIIIDNITYNKSKN